jgi:hypothetical protein
MLRTAASKVMWVGRATVFLVGLSVILALVFGIATTAMGANGNPFLLGKKNVATAVSTLVREGPGPALKVVVGANQPPLTVNASAGKATNLNSDKVDGFEGASFVQGGGKASQGKEAIPSGTTTTILTTSNPAVQVSYTCPSNPPTQNGELSIRIIGTEDLNMIADAHSYNTVQYFQLGPSGFTSVGLQMAAVGDHATVQVQGANVATIEVFTAHRPSNCHSQAQALETR